MSAEFEGTVQEGQTGQTAVLTLDTGEYATKGMVGSWSLDAANFLTYKEIKAASGLAWLNGNQFSLMKTDNSAGEQVSITFDVADSVTARYYDVPVELSQWESPDGMYTHNEGFTVVATLTVLNSDGSLPDEPAEPTYGNIVAVAEPNKTADGVWAATLMFPARLRTEQK